MNDCRLTGYAWAIIGLSFLARCKTIAVDDRQKAFFKTDAAWATTAEIAARRVQVAGPPASQPDWETRYEQVRKANNSAIDDLISSLKKQLESADNVILSDHDLKPLEKSLAEIKRLTADLNGVLSDGSKVQLPGGKGVVENLDAVVKVFEQIEKIIGEIRKVKKQLDLQAFTEVVTKAKLAPWTSLFSGRT